jgi:hypothetical protein
MTRSKTAFARAGTYRSNFIAATFEPNARFFNYGR